MNQPARRPSPGIHPANGAMTFLFAVALLVGMPYTAAADPIHVRYQVTITQSGGAEIDPFQFELSARFDSNFDSFLVEYDDEPGRGELRTIFRDASLSGVPARLGQPPPSWGGFSNALESRYGDILRYEWELSGGYIEVIRQNVTDPVTYLSRTVLYASSDRPLTGPASASTLLALLGHGTFVHEFSQFDWRRQEYLPGSLFYSGFVTQIPDPVPEPATLALLATGLVFIGARRRSEKGRVKE